MRQPVEVRQSLLSRISIVSFTLLSVGLLVWSIITSPTGVFGAIVLVAFGVALMTRIYALKLIADESGLLVRNLSRTRRFRWEEVEDFRWGRRTWGWPFGHVMQVLLRNGEMVNVDLTETGILEFRLRPEGRARTDAAETASVATGSGLARLRPIELGRRSGWWQSGDFTLVRTSPIYRHGEHERNEA